MCRNHPCRSSELASTTPDEPHRRLNELLNSMNDTASLSCTTSASLPKASVGHSPLLGLPKTEIVYASAVGCVIQLIAVAYGYYLYRRFTKRQPLKTVPLKE